MCMTTDSFPCFSLGAAATRDRADSAQGKLDHTFGPPRDAQTSILCERRLPSGEAKSKKNTTPAFNTTPCPVTFLSSITFKLLTARVASC